MYMCTYVGDNQGKLVVTLENFVCTYILVYIHLHMYVNIYIHIYIQISKSGQLCMGIHAN